MSAQTYERWSILSPFSSLEPFLQVWLFWSVSSRFWVDSGADDNMFHKSCESTFYSFMPNSFHFALRSMSAGRCAQTYEKFSNLSGFSHLDPFPQFFGQVEESLI